MVRFGAEKSRVFGMPTDSLVLGQGVEAAWSKEEWRFQPLEFLLEETAIGQQKLSTVDAGQVLVGDIVNRSLVLPCRNEGLLVFVKALFVNKPLFAPC